ESCARCQDEVARLAGAATGLAFATEGPSAPDDLRERLLESARAERGTVVRLRRGWSPRWAAAVAAVAGLAVGGGRWAPRRGRGGAAAGGSRTVALQGAEGKLELDSRGGAVLVVRRLRAAPAGKTYELWVIPKGGKPARAGLFSRAGRVPLERKVPPGA